ncbi:MAG TPA: hypothetical protein PL112_26290 [Candidatus Obscuribacter sp.]|jgi:hypothetical protein|nr:MAG: hypothetical protein BWY75_00609 [bacterium ADurb.Bin425]HMY55168.1 hypothetical protein [Candidatus Obscuribacter sp.]HND70348.1 hypothetical protein [Candidatus Obscuribacter sp.]
MFALLKFEFYLGQQANLSGLAFIGAGIATTEYAKRVEHRR